MVVDIYVSFKVEGVGYLAARRVIRSEAAAVAVAGEIGTPLSDKRKSQFAKSVSALTLLAIAPVTQCTFRRNIPPAAISVRSAVIALRPYRTRPRIRSVEFLVRNIPLDPVNF